MTHETGISRYNIQGDSIKIRGIVEIKNGDNVIIAENKFTQSMLAWFANMCGINYVYGPCCIISYWNISTYAWDIYIGQDQSTPTAYNTTVLVSPIGTSPGMPANSRSGSTSNPSGGVFRTIYAATWNPYAVSGTVGEMALYLSVKDVLQPFGWGIQTGSTETKKLVSRLSAADGNFPPFSINEANPLSIAWTIQLGFI